MSESEKALEELIRELIKTARESDDPEERKQAKEDIKCLFALQSGRKKINNEKILKYVQIFGVPILGFLLLVFYRVLMETETPPDIFFKEIGRGILGLVKFSKV